MVTAATFSEQWYRVADLHVGLLPSVRVHKQIIRKQPWYILTDPYSQRHFQVSPEAYTFLAGLTPRHRVDEVWSRLIDEEPDRAPGQEEVVRILSQLHHANLLYSRSLPDGSGIFERERRMHRREVVGKLLAFLFIRIPLWDPNAWLNRIRPITRLCFSLPSALVWLVVVALGVLAVIEHSGAFYQQTQGVLAVPNLPWLYLCLAGLKTLHELSHALACKRYGGEVHTLGVMFLVFMPLPYMDATSSWSFRERRQRILVSSAGMITELFLAALSALVWANTGAGLVHSLAFNVMLIGSVSSMLFNGNPLLRYDAYYILSDLIDIPNLSAKSSQQWRYLAERHLMGSDTVVSPAGDRRQAVWLTLYGALSTLYRMLISLLIVLIVLDRLFALGVVLIIMSLFVWVIRPAWKMFEYLSSPQIHRHRRQAVTVTLWLLTAAVLLLGRVPFPYGIKAPGVVEAVTHHAVTTPVAGILRQLEVQSGQRVRAGQVLAKLKNPDLRTELTLTRQLILENKHSQRRALWDSPGDTEPIGLQLEMLQKRLSDLIRRRKNLTIRAAADGIWVSPRLHQRLGSWISRGELLGQLIGPKRFRFTAVVSQEQADELFRGTPRCVQLRLRGQAEQCLDLTSRSLTLIPFQRERLASAALGWAGGGMIPTLDDDEGGKRAAEGFFEVRARLPAVTPTAQHKLMHGLSGRLRIGLAPQPVFQQVRRGLLQLLQKRYGVTL